MTFVGLRGKTAGGDWSRRRLALSVIYEGGSRSQAIGGVGLQIVRDWGKPAFIEAFNGRFRVECLNQHWFLTFADAPEKMYDWRRHYNEFRPLGEIGNHVLIA